MARNPMAAGLSLDERIDARDRDARARAVDPRFNVALEASAGTGKTRVLVTRYVNLLRAGVAPGNILAMTFTRKAAAEMRTRIIVTLRLAAERGELTPSQWREIRERMGDVQISTIDAFCLSLLREFPLEAGLDPGFSLADDADVPRLIDESLDRALRVCRGIAWEDEHVALVFAQIGDRRARSGLAALLGRRLVAPAVLGRYLARAPRDLTIGDACATAAGALREVFAAMPGGLPRFVRTGPDAPRFAVIRHGLEELAAATPLEPSRLRAIFAGVLEHFLTQEGQPRSARLLYLKEHFRTPADFQAHRRLVFEHAARVREVHLAFRRDLNVLVSRGVSRMFRIAESEYRRTLEAHAVLDFPEVLLRTLDLLRQMEEFSQSRYRLESRYHHVLVDEFQDTSRAQWELVALLVQAWGAGAGLAYSGPLPPSIFIVGDRKQSIYGFRDAQASILREAAAYLDQLRPDGDVRRSISRSFRSVPEILAFVNDVCQQIEKVPDRDDAFAFEEEDRFPAQPDALQPDADAAVRFVSGASDGQCADLVAGEIARLIGEQATVRDRDTGVRRPIRPADIAILFRTRESHREIAAALERRAIPAYVYKGLGFFDADEIKDVRAALGFLADPVSELRAAAFLRSRFVRLSDEGLRRLAGRLASVLTGDDQHVAALDEQDQATLLGAREACRRWLALADRLPPAELLDRVLTESAYAVELRGPRTVQARENLKKVRGLIRRMQHRGYATLARVTSYLDRLAVSDEADAVIDAADAVNLMTVHAAKGLEFPIVFVVNLSRGTGSRRPPMRISAGAGDDVSVAVGDFESQADLDDAAREREESKRLLYVALTRARDRLYLSTPLEDGRVNVAKGSLAEVLPAFVVARLEAAAGTAPPVRQQHTPAGPVPSAPADHGRLIDGGTPRESVAVATADVRGATAGRGSSRLTGVLVHRLLQRGLDVDGTPDDELRNRVRAALTQDDIIGPEDVDGVSVAAVDIYRRLSANAELRALYGRGVARHEVPFSLREGGRVIRGVIDCVVEEPGRVTVIEFKTGSVQGGHQAQAEMYTRAVRAAYPRADVETRVFYVE